MAVSDSLRRSYAPHGKLRAALNHGNRVLVGRDDQGRAQGITVDLAKGLAAELQLDLEFLEYDGAGQVSNGADADLWDICFLAVDPERRRTITFTQPYIRIEGNYMVRPGIDAVDAGALVASGLGIGSVRGSAYSLHLARQPGADALQIFPDINTALAALDARKIAAVAGIYEAVQAEADKRPGARVLTPPFMEILQAMGMPVGRPEAAAHLSDYLAHLSRTGQVGRILERNGVSAECAVMPD